MDECLTPDLNAHVERKESAEEIVEHSNILGWEGSGQSLADLSQHEDGNQISEHERQIVVWVHERPVLHAGILHGDGPIDVLFSLIQWSLHSRGENGVQTLVLSECRGIEGLNPFHGNTVNPTHGLNTERNTEEGRENVNQPNGNGFFTTYPSSSNGGLRSMHAVAGGLGVSERFTQNNATDAANQARTRIPIAVLSAAGEMRERSRFSRMVTLSAHSATRDLNRRAAVWQRRRLYADTQCRECIPQARCWV